MSKTICTRVVERLVVECFNSFFTALHLTAHHREITEEHWVKWISYIVDNPSIRIYIHIAVELGPM